MSRLFLCVCFVFSAFFASQSEGSRFSTVDGTTFVLSIDGAEMQGIIPARLLMRMEGYFEEKYSYPIRIASLFDAMAGTETGGITVLGLAAPIRCNLEQDHPERGYPAKTLVEMYQTHGVEMFSRGWLGSVQGLENSEPCPHPLAKVLEYFQSFRLKEATTRVLIPTYDLVSNRTHVFDSTDTLLPRNDYAMKDVAMVTSASPNHFPIAEIFNGEKELGVFSTGSFTAKNPTRIAFRKSQGKGEEKLFILSLGTGEGPPEGLEGLKREGVGLEDPIVAMMISGGVKMVHQDLLDLAQDERSEMQYIRIQPSIPLRLKRMDKVTPENIAELMRIADKMFDDPEDANYHHCREAMKRLEQRLAAKGILPLPRSSAIGSSH